jgi:glycosyltransferase involved in cell wall biosynthesis
VSARLQILICNERFLSRFGVDRILIRFGHHLVSLGHGVTFTCLRYDGGLLPAVADVNELSMPEGIELAGADNLAADMVLSSWRENPPDVVITGGWPFFELAARSPTHGVPSVFIDAGAVPHDGYSEPMLSVQREVRRLRRRTLPFIERILPISDFIKETQSEPDRGGPHGVRTVMLGIDHVKDSVLASTLPDTDPAREIVSTLEDLCTDGTRLILALGRFEEQGYKNSKEIFNVYRSIRNKLPNTHLAILAGSTTVAVPPDLSADTTCLPTISDAALWAVMGRSTLGISTSLWEGFNLPLGEMQYLDRPVLAYNVGAHPIVVADPWFLCGSSAEMTRKSLRILTEGVPSVIAERKRFETLKRRAQWRYTLSEWTTEIDDLRSRAHGDRKGGRRLVLIDVTNSAIDPSNSGVIRVTRRLAAQLIGHPGTRLVPIVWDSYVSSYRLPTATERSFLESNAGPKDWLGAVIEKLGEHVSLDDLVLAGDPRTLAVPVVFLPEVILDGSAGQRIIWAKTKGYQVAFLLYDMLPVFESTFIDHRIVDSFPSYLEAMQHADAVWSISEFSRIEFERYFRERGLSLPPSCETVQLPGQLSDRPRFFDQSPVGEEIRVLCVSTIEPRKNHRTLIEGFNKLRTRRPNLSMRLILIGTTYLGADKLREWLLEEIQKDGHIQWRGAVTDTQLVSEYMSSTFTIYPSLAEGFGLPILESLWVGKPCVCHEKGVMAELAADGGCIMVDMSNSTEVSIAMERLSSEPQLREALSRQIRKRAITTWGMYGDEIAARLERL